jgi:Tol biopolymer transport system component
MISRESTSVAGDNVSGNAAISENGNLVAFESTATNLDGGGSVSDIFLFNINSGIMERITVPAAAGPPNNDSVKPDISDDGRYVVFVSSATNLGSCTTGQGDIFVRDRTAATYTCISLDSGGGDANAASTDPAISGDGSTVVFTSTATDLVAVSTGGIANIFARDFTVAVPSTLLVSFRNTGLPTLTGASSLASVSSDGRYVAFTSAANDLVSVDSNGLLDDVFVRDIQGGNADIVLVSVTAAGAQANDSSGNSRISDNGRYVSFDSNAALDPADSNGPGIADVYRGHNASYP